MTTLITTAIEESIHPWVALEPDAQYYLLVRYAEILKMSIRDVLCAFDQFNPKVVIGTRHDGSTFCRVHNESLRYIRSWLK